MTFFAAAIGISIAMWPVMGPYRLSRWFALVGSFAVLFTPLLIAPQHVKLRALACLLAIDLFFKTTDYAAQRKKALVEDPTFLAYAKFLVPFPVLLVRLADRTERSHFRLSDWRRTIGALATFALCFACVQWMSTIASIRSSFLLDHTLKFIVFTIAIESLACLFHQLERHVGYDTNPLINRAYLSLTVGEFWYRYNTRVHSWLEHNVFRPSGGRRAPVRGILLTFLVSAVFHDLMFAVATSRIDGYQFAFFMLQAPAVIVGYRVQRAVSTSVLGRIALRSSTIVWMWATSMLFFHGVNRVFPFFYASDPWLP